jgi:FOG: Ankyrin repeat
LFVASLQGHLEIVQALLAAKADVNAKVNDGPSALLMASQQGHVEVVRTLLAANADVNAAAANGATPLLSAVGMAMWMWYRPCLPRRPM